MNSLSIDAINIHSPYIVGSDGKALIFVTDSGITYRVDFELDSNPFFTAYWFNLANPNHMKSPNDVKIEWLRAAEEVRDAGLRCEVGRRRGQTLKGLCSPHRAAHPSFVGGDRQSFRR